MEMVSSYSKKYILGFPTTTDYIIFVDDKRNQIKYPDNSIIEIRQQSFGKQDFHEYRMMFFKTYG